MQHVRKQHPLGSAVATAAMLAGLSYEEVLARLPGLDVDRTRQPEELCALLDGLTGTPWRFTPFRHPRPRVHEFSSPWPVAAFIQESAFQPRFGRWVVVTGEAVHDPAQSRAYPASGHPCRDWVVSGIIEPVRPEELARGQARDQPEKQPGENQPGSWCGWTVEQILEREG